MGRHRLELRPARRRPAPSVPPPRRVPRRVRLRRGPRRVRWRHSRVDEPLHVLLRKSLITESPSTRLRLLESIRAYARDQMREAGEYEQIARAPCPLVRRRSRHRGGLAHGLDRHHPRRPRGGNAVGRRTRPRDPARARSWSCSRSGYEKDAGTKAARRARRVLEATEDVAVKARWNALGNAGQLASEPGARRRSAGVFRAGRRRGRGGRRTRGGPSSAR